MDNNVYKFIITDETQEAQNSPVASQSPSGGATSTAKSKNVSKGQLGGLVAYQKIKPFVVQGINNEVAKVQLRTGSNRLQEKADFINQVAQGVFNFGESIVAGAMVGGVPGAIIGGVLSLSHTLITYANNQSVIDLQRSIEHEGLYLNYIRAGAQGSRSSR
jgi:hypothetical protein